MRRFLIIDAGLTDMLKDSGFVPLAEGDGRKNIRSQMPVGTLVLHAGLCWSSLDDYGEFIRIVDKDQYRASEAIQMAFIQACEKAGIPFQESIRPVGCPSRRRSTATPSSASLKGRMHLITCEGERCIYLPLGGEPGHQSHNERQNRTQL